MSVIISVGEPAGIGPDVVLDVLPQLTDRPTIVANQQMMIERANALGVKLDVTQYDWVDLPLAEPVVPGSLNVSNAAYVLDCLSTAAKLAMETGKSLVTAPVHKGVIADSGVNFSGHTEFFRDIAGVDHVVMMLASKAMRVALVTTHLPLRDVAEAISPDLLRTVLGIVHRSLETQFHITNPRIGVCGLNPHAGESGHMGREEIDVIEPMLVELGNTMNLTGPLPADTIFAPQHREQFDVIVAMYHDQGLAPLKAVSFSESVNITLGLPFIRTSVDHGTALNLAGTGQADSSSLWEAIEQARALTA